MHMTIFIFEESKYIYILRNIDGADIISWNLGWIIFSICFKMHSDQLTDALMFKWSIHIELQIYKSFIHFRYIKMHNISCGESPHFTHVGGGRIFQQQSHGFVCLWNSAVTLATCLDVYTALFTILTDNLQSMQKCDSWILTFNIEWKTSTWIFGINISAILVN